MANEYTQVIRNAVIYDGTGAAPREGDIALQGERIAQLGTIPDGQADQDLDVQGQAVSPGFIDVHTHDDFAAVLHPDMSFKLLGGVTTCIVGNCGMGAAPFQEASHMAQAFHPNHTLPLWEGYPGYFQHLKKSPPSLNIGVLVGHGTMREAIVGSENRPPSGQEMQAMKQLLQEGLDAGAVGFSTGLIYKPGCFAATEELIELAALMEESGGLYATHIRNEGETLLEALQEAITIGEKANVPVQLSHHKASGRGNWGKVAESLRLIERAQAQGVAIHADQYPYTAGSTILSAVVENAFNAQGGGLGELNPADVVIASTKHHPEWEGKSLETLCAELAKSPQQTADYILEKEPGTTVILHSMSEADVQTVMKHASTMIGSDGIPTLEGRPHPRLYGTFARVLGHYSRKLELFSLAEAIHRMTGFSAKKFRLRDRGELGEGAFADLVVFDPQTIIDQGTFEDPNHNPQGIAHLFVNGVHVVSHGEHTGLRPGKALQRAPQK